GKPISLPPKAFETLLVLIRSSGHVIPKDELMSQVWADAFVEEVNLARNIWTLRKALGDDHVEHRFIHTVPKVAYRFVAEVTELEDEGVGLLIQRRMTARIVKEELETSAAPNSEIAVRNETPRLTGARRAGRWIALTVLAGAALTTTIILGWFRLHAK